MKRRDMRDWSWLIAASEGEAPGEATRHSPARGILVALPLSGLLWWGLVLLWRAIA